MPDLLRDGNGSLLTNQSLDSWSRGQIREGINIGRRSRAIKDDTDSAILILERFRIEPIIRADARNQKQEINL
jgi:hypothetical protein